MTEPLATRRRRLLREEISRVAVHLFADNGFDNVPVSEIATAAGLSERTFFRYFATKEEVLLDYERQLWNRLIEALATRPADEGPVTSLRQAFLVTSRVSESDRPRVVQLGRILAQAPGLLARSIGERLVNDDKLIALVAKRLGGNSAAARSTARVIASAMNSVAAAEFIAWVEGGGRGDPAVRIGDALSILEAGLAQFDSTKVRGK